MLALPSNCKLRASGLDSQNYEHFQPVPYYSLPLVCLLLWALPNSALADSTTMHSKFVGVYLSHAAGPSMNLSLGADGSATGYRRCWQWRHSLNWPLER